MDSNAKVSNDAMDAEAKAKKSGKREDYAKAQDAHEKAADAHMKTAINSKDTAEASHSLAMSKMHKDRQSDCKYASPN